MRTAATECPSGVGNVKSTMLAETRLSSDATRIALPVASAALADPALGFADAAAGFACFVADLIRHQLLLLS